MIAFAIFSVVIFLIFLIAMLWLLFKKDYEVKPTLTGNVMPCDFCGEVTNWHKPVRRNKKGEPWKFYCCTCYFNGNGCNTNSSKTFHTMGKGKAGNCKGNHLDGLKD